MIAEANKHIPTLLAKFDDANKTFNENLVEIEKLDAKINTLSGKVSLSTNEVANLDKYNSSLQEFSFKQISISDKIFGLGSALTTAQSALDEAN